MFAPAGAGITMKEIDDIYNQKSVKNVTLEQYRKNALEFIKDLSAAGLTKSAILEQLTCL
jgi:phosphoribosylformylglycinamidine (FGAM) synthase-like enzyme